MKRYFLSNLIIAALVVVAAFTGCNKDKPNNPEQIAVNLRANINSTTKVSGNQWHSSDRVGIYMKRTGQQFGAFGALEANNVEMSISGQELVANPPLMYPGSGNVDFIAYYPYNASVGSDYTIAVNVANQATGLPSEILYSNNITNQEATESYVELEFYYSLAKFVLIVTCDDLTPADFAALTASIEGMYTQAKFRLADGYFSDFAAIQPITLFKKSHNATSATFEALILPDYSGQITFVFNLNGETYRYDEDIYVQPALYSIDFAFCSDTPPIIEPNGVTLLNATIHERSVYEYKMGYRSDPVAIPMSIMNMLGAVLYSEVMSDYSASNSIVQIGAMSDWVRNSGNRIRQAVEQYYMNEGKSSVLNGFAWHYELIADPTVNTWCMPGGRVAFYEGIMPLCMNEAGVAVVMGHLIAHAVSNHDGVRLFQQLELQLGVQSLDVAISLISNNDPAVKQIALSVFGVSGQHGLLAYSRNHEYESDKMGMIFMAMAGYDPREAPKFWERMAANFGMGGSDFFSTHPSNANRINAMNEAMSEAMAYYNP